MKTGFKYKEYLRRIFESPTARVLWVMLGGSLMNLIYIGTNLASAVLYRSIWSATLTVYHLMLIIIRIYLILEGRRRGRADERRICLRVGLLMLLLDIAAAMIMLYSIRRRSFVSYSGVILLGFLIFTVYSVARSVSELRKHRESENHLYFTARNLTLSTSLMSVFNLQYSVFSLLGADYLLTGRAILLCGLSVFSIILFLSLSLMRRGVRE